MEPRPVAGHGLNKLGDFADDDPIHAETIANHAAKGKQPLDPCGWFTAAPSASLS